MRIALVTPGFSASDQDWCIPVLQNLARFLAQQHDVTVYSIAYPPTTGRYRVKGVATYSAGDGRRGRIAALRRFRRVVATIRHDHRERPFDLLHGFWPDSGGVVCRLAAHARKIPWLVTAMGGEFIDEPAIGYGKRRMLAGRLARLGCTGAANVNVGSVYHRNRIRTEARGLDPTIVRLGIDPGLFNAVGPAMPLEGLVPVLSVGSLVPVKGHETLLQAIARVRRRVDGVHLHIVGDGPLRRTLAGSCRSLRIEQHVTFHGNVSHEDLPAYYRGAAFCVLGSYFENIAMVISEAAACDRVTIGSAVGVLPELCPAELAVTPGDVEALSAAIVETASDPFARARWAAKARSETAAHFVIDETVQAFESLYKQIVG